jgi:hypothetical protein
MLRSWFLRVQSFIDALTYLRRREGRCPNARVLGFDIVLSVSHLSGMNMVFSSHPSETVVQFINEQCL